MAKQSSHLTLQGSIGEVTYVKTPDGYYIRRKNKISKERFATDPAFEQQREHNAEFTRAVNAAKLIRDAILDYVQQAKDRTTSRRLSTVMLQVVKSDAVNESGKRKVIAANTELLKGFNFNANAVIDSVLKLNPATLINRATGQLQIATQAFVPTTNMSTPEGATHFRLIAAGVEADFDSGKAVQDFVQSALLPIDSQLTAPVSLTMTLPAASPNALFLVFGVQFFRNINGFSKQIRGMSHNALVIADVSGS